MKKSELEEKIRDFSIDEGVLGKKIPDNPKLEFGYELKYPPKASKPMRILLIKAKDSKAISFQIATQIAKKHIETLTKRDPKGLVKFFVYFKKHMLTQNLLYNLDPKKARYIVLDNIYPDALTEDNFYRTIRRVFNAAVYINMILMEFIMGKISDKTLKKGEEFDVSSGNTMFA